MILAGMNRPGADIAAAVYRRHLLEFSPEAKNYDPRRLRVFGRFKDPYFRTGLIFIGLAIVAGLIYLTSRL